MSATTFPYGYNGTPAGMGTMLTWQQMMTKSTVYKLHPEVQRRFHALIEAAASVGVALGCGTGWRVQPNPPPPGFAKPGNSYHEGFPADGTSGNAMAIDTVCDVSWSWLERNCGAYGFRTFRNVNGEPWHIQPVEIPTSRNYATTAPPLPMWPLPTTPPSPPTPSEEADIVELLKTELTPSNRAQTKGNGDVHLIQFVALGLYRMSGNPDLDCGNPDGDYGPRTQKAVTVIQALHGLAQDACCGPKTWTAALNGDGT